MKEIIISNSFSELRFDMVKGVINTINLNDGIHDKSILAGDILPCHMDGLTCVSMGTTADKGNCIVLEGEYVAPSHKVNAVFELYKSGYVICTFKIDSTEDNDSNGFLLGANLDTEAVFSSNYDIKHMDPDDRRRYVRAASVVFSTDDRPVTNSFDVILESVGDGKKVLKEKAGSKFIGWEIQAEELRRKGASYTNRWCFHFSHIDNSPNKVRGQRIYHWYGFYPELPSMDLIDEMAEYGCSILILHMPSFKWIDGSKPVNEFNFRAVIDKAHKHGIKMMFYIQPILISLNSPEHKKLEHTLNDNGKLCWHSLKDTQIVFYVPNSDYDCDELCLRCEEAYDYVKTTVLECYRKYGFDGLYIDFAWPSIAVCTDEKHGHKSNLFNFYDYLRMMREFRDEIGPDGIMIGHGGSLLVSSDYAEGFDACLTGEGQKDLSPDVIGVQTGTAPTLWTMHRRKERQFRSKEVMGSIIREGITPHIGQGILGKSIMASLDPAHTPHFIALWQMWRSFPMEKSAFYNYLTEKMVSLDNDEVTYSMYRSPENQIMIIVCNAGGPESESAVSVSVGIQLDTEKLSLPESMSCWILKGNTYENFRIMKSDDVINGYIKIPEIGIDEFIGIILSDGKPPTELTVLEKHLEGRFDRLPRVYKNKMRRFKESDRMIDEFNKLDVKNMTEDEFMKDRIME